MGNPTLQSTKFVGLASAVLLALSGISACSSGSGSSDPEGTGGTSNATGGSNPGTGGTGATSTGGTVATGGGATGGGSTGGSGTTGGTGGMTTGTGGTTAMSVCDEPGKTMVRIAGYELISDLENEDKTGWYVYQSTATDEGTVSVDGVIEEGGANESEFSIHYAGSGWVSYGAGMGFGLGCTDVSAFTGISFWAKGTTSESESPSPPKDANVINFQVAIPETHAKNTETVPGENIGGDCEPDSGMCYGHPAIDITLTEEWTKYEIPFEDLSPATNGVIATYDGIIMALGWHSLGGDFDFWVDEVMLY